MTTTTDQKVLAQLAKDKPIEVHGPSLTPLNYRFRHWLSRHIIPEAYR